MDLRLFNFERALILDCVAFMLFKVQTGNNFTRIYYATAALTFCLGNQLLVT